MWGLFQQCRFNAEKEINHLTMLRVKKNHLMWKILEPEGLSSMNGYKFLAV